MDCEKCPYEQRIEQIEADIVSIREKHARDNEKFFGRIQDLEKEYAVLKNDVGYIRKTVDEVSANLKMLMAAPGKRYETIVACVITTVVGTVIGLLLSGALHP